MINGVGNIGYGYGYGVLPNYQVKQNPDETLLNFGQAIALEPKQEKISFGEGCGLIVKGIGKQVGDMITTIFKHPAKTLLAVGGTTLGLMALPLVGIPVAVGGAALAVGFAGLAAIKGIKHASQFARNNRAGNYDEARKNLEQIGGDTVDLALSAPFVPKGIKSIKKFAKYGKVGVNHQALAELKSAKGLKGKFKSLKTTGKNAERSVNFSEVTENELSKLNGVTDAEKARIRQYIQDYNVPKEQIPEVVLEQWAKEHGISTKPKLSFVATQKNTLGSASPVNGNIVVKDTTLPDLPPSTGGQIDKSWRSVKSRLVNPYTYEETYQNTLTGQTRIDYIDKATRDARTNLLNETRNLSPEANMIDTIVHEREHIDQFARIYKIGEKFKGCTPSAEAQTMYRQMAAEMAPMTPQEIAKYKAMANYNKSGTLATYIMEPCEIGAREAEAKLLAKQEFRILDEVFKETAKVPPSNVKSDLIMNAVRTQSAIS